MGIQVINESLSVQTPASPTSITVLNLQTDSFVTQANRENSFFIVAKDIEAAPPNGAVQFSVRGDGVLVCSLIESPTIAALQTEIANLSGLVRQLQTEILELQLGSE